MKRRYTVILQHVDEISIYQDEEVITAIIALAKRHRGQLMAAVAFRNEKDEKAFCEELSRTHAIPVQ